MSYDQNLADCEAALADLAATANHQSRKLTEANNLLEQTIEVLEDFGTRQRNEGYMFSAAEWWFAFGQPLLDNLKALKKEGTE